MTKKIFLLLNLIRFNKPAGILLLFFPTAFGALIAAKNNVPTKWLIIFFIGSILLRSIGCIINDMADHKFDKLVERTKDRPIASGLLSIKESFFLVVFLSIPALCVFYKLNIQAKTLSLIASIFVLIYPFAKRFTNWPQIFLGICFGLASVIGYVQIRPVFDFEIIMLFIAIMFWVLNYDTIYGFMDIKDDQKIGVKSSAQAIIHRNPKIWLGIFNGFFMATIIMLYLQNFNSQAGMALLIGMSIMSGFQINDLNLNDQNSCQAYFNNNIVTGSLILFAFLLGLWNNCPN